MGSADETALERLAALLRAYRGERTQRAVAERMGYSRVRVTQAENAADLPTRQFMRRWLDATGLAGADRARAGRLPPGGFRAHAATCGARR